MNYKSFMGGSQSKMNKLLHELSETNDEGKGALGEALAFEALKRYKDRQKGSILVSGLSYPYFPGVPGNLKLVDGELKRFDDANADDETDLVLITPFRIFLCEVKAYRYTIEFTNEWTFRSKNPVEKSIPAQAEKHARHFYYNYFDVLPDGAADYIVPLMIIADKSDIADRRDKKWSEYIPVTNLNRLNKTVSELDRPLEYLLDVQKVFETFKARNTGIGMISL